MAEKFIELKEQLQQGTFYYHKFGLLVKGKVKLVLQVINDTLNVNFTGGCVDIYKDRIKPVKGPGNIIADFEWCYMLRNECNDVIGYIGLKTDNLCIEYKSKDRKFK